MIRALCFCLLLGVQVTAVPLQIRDFPAIDQRSIEGASERCGTVALGSWLLWLGTHGTPELLSTDPPIDGNPFARAALPTAARSTLSQLDATYGGTQEIKLLRMIEGLVDYFHRQPTESLELTLRYFNLPDAAALRELNNSEAAVVLLHGIYRTNATTGELMRVCGHYTCLVGQSNDGLITNTYGQNYSFYLDAIPMQRLQAADRYKPKGMESLVYWHYPKSEYPRYRLNVYAAQDPETAQMLRVRTGPSFVKPDEVILVEGALALWLDRIK